jgi:hypothetical protein
MWSIPGRCIDFLLTASRSALRLSLLLSLPSSDTLGSLVGSRAAEVCTWPITSIWCQRLQPTRHEFYLNPVYTQTVLQLSQKDCHKCTAHHPGTLRYMILVHEFPLQQNPHKRPLPQAFINLHTYNESGLILQDTFQWSTAPPTSEHRRKLSCGLIECWWNLG